MSLPIHVTTLLMFKPGILWACAGTICLNVLNFTYPVGMLVALWAAACCCHCAGVLAAAFWAHVCPTPLVILLPFLSVLPHIVQVGGVGGAGWVLLLVGITFTFGGWVVLAGGFGLPHIAQPHVQHSTQKNSVLAYSHKSTAKHANLCHCLQK